MSERTELHVPPEEGPAAALWRLWRRGQRPDVRRFLADAGPLFPGQVAAVLQVDQHERWHDGERVPAEVYLRDFAPLAAERELAVELVYREFLVREKLGESPAPEEYLRRFPEYAERLRQQFAFHAALGSLSPGGEAETSPPGAVGPAVPGYEILGELGRGGMAVVYKARQTSLNRIVALKMIRAGAEAEREELDRFRHEAEAVASLKHPHVVQIHDIGDHNGCPFFALEYVEGGSLAARLAGQPLPAREAARLVETLARTMQYAHERGFVHRDLKPANVLLQADRTAEGAEQRRGGADPSSLRSSAPSAVASSVPKIADFGLAKRLPGTLGAEPASWRTETGVILGTASYMAPEQARGARSGDQPGESVGPAADVYGLGAILYELLTGRPPFRGETTLATLLQVLHEEPVPPSRLQAGLPRDLETVCLKCLAKEPRQRYASAAALADDLRRFQAGEPIRARPTPPWERAWKYARRRPAATALAVVTAVVVLALPWVVRTGLDDYRHRATAAAQRDYQTFLDAREKAIFQRLEDLFKGTPSAGPVQPPDRGAVQEVAQEALTLVGVDLRAARPPRPVVSPYLSEAQKNEVAVSCYELLLILAESAARSPRERNPKDRADDALNILQTAAELGIATQTYHRRRADYLAQAGDGAAAERERQRADQVERSALDDFFSGEEYYRHGDLERANSAFAKALVTRPDHFPARFYVALCSLRSGQWAEALGHLSTCAPLHPEFVWTYLFRGVAATYLEEPEQAEGDFRRAEELIPRAEQLGSDPVARYVLYLNRGALRLNQERNAEAADDFQRARALRPDEYPASVNLAMVFLNRGATAEADREFRQASRLQPPAPVQAAYHVFRGRKLHLAKRYDEALQACGEAIAISPRSPDAYELQGRVLLDQGHHRRAFDSFGQYLERGGKVSVSLYRGLGLARAHLGDYAGAVEDYSQALELRPDAGLYAYRGWAYILSEAWQPALADFEEALRREPANGDAALGRGYALVMLGSYRDGVKAAQNLPGEPATPEMQVNLGCLFAQASAKVQGDATEPDRPARAAEYQKRAVGALRRAMELVPPAKRAGYWQDKVLTDKALDPIRPHLGQLQAELGFRDDRPVK
jgi:eukaryotic-like serine/threonine-protein kinase